VAARNWILIQANENGRQELQRFKYSKQVSPKRRVYTMSQSIQQ
jgi:hypothetical protein